MPIPTANTVTISWADAAVFVSIPSSLLRLHPFHALVVPFPSHRLMNEYDNEGYDDGNGRERHEKLVDAVVNHWS